MSHPNPERDYKPIHTPVYTQADLERATARMRDRCVERVKLMHDEFEAAGNLSKDTEAYCSYSAMKAAAKSIITALESLETQP